MCKAMFLWFCAWYLLLQNNKKSSYLCHMPSNIWMCNIMPIQFWRNIMLVNSEETWCQSILKKHDASQFWRNMMPVNSEETWCQSILKKHDASQFWRNMMPVNSEETWCQSILKKHDASQFWRNMMPVNSEETWCQSILKKHDASQFWRNMMPVNSEETWCQSILKKTLNLTSVTGTDWCDALFCTVQAWLGSQSIRTLPFKSLEKQKNN